MHFFQCYFRPPALALALAQTEGLLERSCVTANLVLDNNALRSMLFSASRASASADGRSFGAIVRYRKFGS